MLVTHSFFLWNRTCSLRGRYEGEWRGGRQREEKCEEDERVRGKERVRRKGGGKRRREGEEEEERISRKEEKESVSGKERGGGGG